jgi:uncharacterized membrane protein YhhN
MHFLPVHTIVLVLIIVAALFSTFGKVRGNILYGIAKPFPLLILIGALIWGFYRSGHPDLFSIIIGMGLVFGLVGDILLIQERRFFIPGLVAFLLGHLLYISAFIHESNTISFYGFIPIVFIAVFFVVFIFKMEPAAKKLLPAIAVYVLALCLMCVSAFSFDLSRGAGFPLFSVGALFFCFSDAALSWTLFVKETRVSNVLVLISYFTAQTIIAFGVIDILIAR